jgi:valyl-tRNA synthetase
MVSMANLALFDKLEAQRATTDELDSRHDIRSGDRASSVIESRVSQQSWQQQAQEVAKR